MTTELTPDVTADVTPEVILDATYYNLAQTSLREVNQALHADDLEGEFVLDEPFGAHAVAVGVNAPVKIAINGHVGYYAAGMNQQAEIVIAGNAGPGVAENMMSGTVVVKGNASQSAGATPVLRRPRREYRNNPPQPRRLARQSSGPRLPRQRP